MGKYSHSKLSTFEQCPFRFKLRYIDKIKPEIEKSIEAHLGTAVHDTLEWIYLKAQKQNPPKIDEVIAFYTDSWKKDFSENIEIVKDLTPEDYFNKGVQFLLNYYQRHFPFQDGTIELEKEISIKLGQNK